jgi:hypothetical protein
LAALRSSKPPDPDRSRTLAPVLRARDVSVACLSATQDGLVQLRAGAPRRVDLAISAVCKTARARFDSAARLQAPADGSEDRLLSGPAKARTLPGAPRRVRLQVRSSVFQADQMGSIPIRGALSLPADPAASLRTRLAVVRLHPETLPGSRQRIWRRRSERRIRSSTLRESTSEHGAMVAHYSHTVGIGRFEYGARFHSRRRRAASALS